MPQASVHAQWVHADGGPVQDLGGGGGVAYAANQAVPGNHGFTLGLMDEDPAAFIGILNLAPAGSATFTCGDCVWVPFKKVFVQALDPDPAPTYQVLPIPCQPGLVGAAFDFQWTLLGTSDTPCPLFANASLSNAIRVTVGP